jgi:hypothetical protein
MEDANETQEQPPSKRPLIKRRWAIVRSASGGAVVLAVAGAIALSDPNDQVDYTQDPAGGDAEISAEA